MRVELNLGCGLSYNEPHINIDLRPDYADIVCNITKLPFEDGSVDYIYASHVLEHCSNRYTSDGVLKEWVRTLKSGGSIDIMSPNVENYMRKYIAGEIPLDDIKNPFYGEEYYTNAQHRDCYDRKSLTYKLIALGCEIVENWNDETQFKVGAVKK